MDVFKRRLCAQYIHQIMKWVVYTAHFTITAFRVLRLKGTVKEKERGRRIKPENLRR